MDCKNACSNNGVCRKYKCYCEPEYTGFDCSISVEEDINAGTPLHKALYYFYLAAFIGFVVGLIVVKHLIEKNKEREYMRFNDD